MMTEIRVKGEKDHQILPREELGRLLESGQVEGVFKYGLSERKEPADDVTKATYRTDNPGLRGERPTASAVITASTLDRDGDIVRADGLDVKHYLKNPIVLPMHTIRDDVYPVALTERMKATRNAWWAQWQWLVDLEPTAKRAAEYMLMWDASVLNCTSIGFIPTKWEPMKDGGGYDFQGAELLEFSTVFIPSNRDALRTEGMKHFLDVAGELITAGPSPLMKGWLVAKEAEGRPKQVAVGGVVEFTDELAMVGGAGEVSIVIDGKEIAKEVADAVRGKGAEGREEVRGQEEVEHYGTLADVKMACAAGVLPVERAFEEIERLMSELESGADAARADAESWKTRCAALSARVVKRYGGDRDGDERARSH